MVLVVVVVVMGVLLQLLSNASLQFWFLKNDTKIHINHMQLYHKNKDILVLIWFKADSIQTNLT